MPDFTSEEKARLEELAHNDHFYQDCGKIGPKGRALLFGSQETVESIDPVELERMRALIKRHDIRLSHYYDAYYGENIELLMGDDAFEVLFDIASYEVLEKIKKQHELSIGSYSPGIQHLLLTHYDTLCLFAKTAEVPLKEMLDLGFHTLSSVLMAYDDLKEVLPLPMCGMVGIWALSMVQGKSLEEEVKSVYADRMHTLTGAWRDVESLCCLMARGAPWEQLMALDSDVLKVLLSSRFYKIASLIDQDKLNIEQLFDLINVNKERAKYFMENAKAVKCLCEHGATWGELVALEQSLLEKVVTKSDKICALLSAGGSFNEITHMNHVWFSERADRLGLDSSSKKSVIVDCFVGEVIKNADTLAKWQLTGKSTSFDQLVVALYHINQVDIYSQYHNYRLAKKCKLFTRLLEAGLSFELAEQAMQAGLFKGMLSRTGATIALGKALSFDALLTLNPNQMLMLLALTYPSHRENQGWTPFIDGTYSLDLLKDWDSVILEEIISSRKSGKIFSLCRHAGIPLNVLVGLEQPDIDYLLTTTGTNGFLKYYVENSDDRDLLKQNETFICHPDILASAITIIRFLKAGFVSKDLAVEATVSPEFFGRHADGLQKMLLFIGDVPALQALEKTNRPRFDCFLRHHEGLNTLIECFDGDTIKQLFYRDPVRFDFMLEKSELVESLVVTLHDAESLCRVDPLADEDAPMVKQEKATLLKAFLSMDFSVLETMINNWEAYTALSNKISQVPHFADRGGRVLSSQLKMISKGIDKHFLTLPVQAMLKPGDVTDALIKDRRTTWIVSAAAVPVVAGIVALIPFMLGATLTASWIAGIVVSVIVGIAFTSLFSVQAHRCTAPMLKQRFLKKQADFNKAVGIVDRNCDKFSSNNDM